MLQETNASILESLEGTLYTRRVVWMTGSNVENGSRCWNGRPSSSRTCLKGIMKEQNRLVDFDFVHRFANATIHLISL